MAGKTKGKKNEQKVLRITLVKSPISYPVTQKRTVRALGLRKMNQTIEHLDSPSMRGMLASVSHLVKIENLE